MKDIGPIREVVDDDQDCVAFLVAVVFVILGHSKCSIYYLLHLLRVPLIKEVLFLLLVKLITYILLHRTPGAIVMNRRTEDVDG